MLTDEKRKKNPGRQAIIGFNIVHKAIVNDFTDFSFHYLDC